jgi:hypothetical protein
MFDCIGTIAVVVFLVIVVVMIEVFGSKKK